jgi:alkanesulfonate monooxygenase SsuD/methylene tetrahydromethanopterin reductase-like flavin-dependent oxidoreductase (luciferase family)
VQIGVALGTLDLQTGEAVPLGRLAEHAARAEALGYASAWAMDHFWIERDGRRRGAHDPFVTVAYLAARTSTITLGALVACAPFRHPAQLAREAAALVEAAPGRIVLGLGAGWHQPEFDAFAFPFERKVARLEEYVPIVARLLAGERITHRGRFYNLSGASIVTSQPAPPVWVAGSGPRMLELTARHAAGWNVAWEGPDPAGFQGLLRELREAERRAGRDKPVVASVGILADPHDSTDLKATMRAYEQAGADHLIFNFSRQPFAAFDRRAMEKAAAAVLPG